MNKHNLLIAFYGDDFTGSTDALEVLCCAGAKTVLFIDPPTAGQLDAYPDLDAIGVAGFTRSMTPGEMEATLFPAFEMLKELGPRHIHYKVCSTFDSTASIGSIGRAIDTGVTVFKNKFIPLVVGAPVLGRYVVFGNLFARFGTGAAGEIFRIDRHPSMSKHPVTPADEADLRSHLSKQTEKKIGLLDIISIDKAGETMKSDFDWLLAQKNEIILFDTLKESQLSAIGRLIDDYAENSGPLFSAGSSGMEMALGKAWNEKGWLKEIERWPALAALETILVISGTCSPVTAAQVDHAIQNGFKELIADINEMTAEDSEKELAETVIEKAKELIRDGYSVIIHTNGAAVANQTGNVPAVLSGTALGKIAKAIVAATKVQRIIIAGGDTSGYAARAMGIEAVEMIASLVKGAPVCRAIAPGSPLHDKEVNFKGGQVGAPDYFSKLKEGQ